MKKIPLLLLGGIIGMGYFLITFGIEYVFRCQGTWEFTGHCGELYSPFAWLNFPASIVMIFTPYLLIFGTFTQVVFYYFAFDTFLGVIVGWIVDRHRKSKASVPVAENRF